MRKAVVRFQSIRQRLLWGFGLLAALFVSAGLVGRAGIDANCLSGGATRAQRQGGPGEVHALRQAVGGGDGGIGVAADGQIAGRCGACRQVDVSVIDGCRDRD